MDLGIVLGVVVMLCLFGFAMYWGDKESKQRAASQPPKPTWEDRIVARSAAITNRVFMPAVWPRIEEVHARPDVTCMTEAQRTTVTDALIERFYEPLMEETIEYRNWLWDSERTDEATAPAPLAPAPPPEIVAEAIAAGRSAS